MKRRSSNSITPPYNARRLDQFSLAALRLNLEMADWLALILSSTIYLPTKQFNQGLTLSGGGICRGHHQCGPGWSMISAKAIWQPWGILRSSGMTTLLLMSLIGYANADFWRSPPVGVPGWRWRVGLLFLAGTLLPVGIRPQWVPDAERLATTRQPIW